MSPSQPDREYELTSASLNLWREQFANSPTFSNLNAVEQNCAAAIIESFAQCAFRYLNASPQSWNTEIVRECCSEILPRKIAKGAWFFESVEPVLTRFFTFLGDNGLLPQGRSLAEAVENANLAAIINSENPVRWGPAKSFMMAAREAGVDLREPEGVVFWCNQLNAQRQEQFN